MSPVRSRIARLLQSPLAGAALVTGVAGALLVAGVAEPLRRLAADAGLRAAVAHAPEPPAGIPDVALVAIDPRSLRALPDWPWSRSVHGALVERLDAAGASAIAFDVDFSSARDPEADAAFGTAIERSGRVVLAGFRQVQPIPGVGEIEIASLPIPPLAQGAAGVGSVLVPVDADGVVRRAPRSSDVAGRALPSLAAAMLGVALREPVRVRPGALVVDFRRAEPPLPTLSAVDVLEGRFDPRDVAGRAVLVGATAAEFQDLWPTPLGPARPGVWIQALAYRTLAAERAGAPVLTRPPLAFEIAQIALAAWVAGLLGRTSHRRRLAGLAALSLALVAGGFAALVSTGLLPDPVLPLLAVAGQYALGLERVRDHFQKRLHERDLSLSALFRVGEAAAGAEPAGGLDLGLALLGDVVEASGVAFLGATPQGALDGRRIEWRRRGEGEIGDPAVAESVLRGRALRVRPGDGPRGGGLAVYAPLLAAETPVGVLVVERDDAAPLDTTQLRTIATVGAQLALSVENLRLVDDLRRTFDSSIEAIATAIEARDGYTESHCRRLALFSVRMGERLGLDPETVEGIRLGALLHDVGKIGVRDEILLKPGRFDASEREEMRAHAVIGHRIIRGIAGLSSTTHACVRHHHECWDGSGYPDGLAGEDIPLAARIVSVVDVWDALSTDRPYKRAYPQERVLDLLRKGRGTSFDPDLVELFLGILEEEGEEMLGLLPRTPGRAGGGT